MTDLVSPNPTPDTRYERAEYSKRYRENNPEVFRQSQRKYHRNNREKRSAYAREWYERNKEAVKAYAREYYWTHREECLERERIRRQERKARGEALLREVLNKRSER